MSKPFIKFKTREAWNEPWQSHYLTFSTFHRRPYLGDVRICEMLAKLINKAANRHNFIVLAYVFMPDHVHILVHPLNEKYDMPALLKALKQGPSQSARKHGWIDTLLWQRGGGHDDNTVGNEARQSIINYIHQNPVRKGIVEESWRYRWSSANWYLSDEKSDVICKRLFFEEGFE